MRGGRYLRAAGVALLVALAWPTAALAEPDYQSVRQDVFVTMDDGVRVAGSLNLPSLDGTTPAPGRFPVVLSMTPYGRAATDPTSRYAELGYIGAIFDVRGTGGSEGNLNDNYFSPRESRDTAAVIDHLGTRQFSNGRVGMVGGSYQGITQYLAAARQPRHLKAIVPGVALSDIYRDATYHGGAFSQFFGAQYLFVQGIPGLIGANDPGSPPQFLIDAKLDQAQSEPLAFDYFESGGEDSSFFRERSPIELADRIEVPTLIYGGWFDGLSARGGPEMYEALSERRGVETRLVMDPITHKGNGPPFDLSGYTPQLDDFQETQDEFLARHLQGARTPARDPVKLFVMGRDEYVESDRYPLPGTRSERLYVKPDGFSSSPVGDGQRSYFTNPAQGYSVTFDRHGTVAASPYAPLDQHAESELGLRWESDPLEKPLTVAGPISMRLLASATASDTDWYVRVTDIAPDGSTRLLTPGYLRASHRALDRGESTPLRPYHTHVDPTPITPDERITYDIEVWPTANEFKRGHRIQVQLTSADTPNHMPGTLVLDRDDPTRDSFTPLPPSTNTVHFGGRDGTSLLLPVARGSVEDALGDGDPPGGGDGDPGNGGGDPGPGDGDPDPDDDGAQGDGPGTAPTGDSGDSGGGGPATDPSGVDATESVGGGELPFTGVELVFLSLLGALLAACGWGLRRRLACR